MSRDQLDSVSELLRNGPLDLGGDVPKMREVFAEMIAAVPVPDDVRTRQATLGGVPAVEVTAGESIHPGGRVLYFHGGGYALGSAATSVALVADIARRAGATALTVDYRLAPGHPFPAAVDDAVAAYRALLDQGVPAASVAVVGESAGGGLALALLLRARAEGLPLPAAAALLSPWTDLTLSGASTRTKADVDPALTRDALAVRADDYLAGADPATPLASPLHADLHGLPPLLVQVGGAEILLDDALRLVARAAHHDVDVTLRTFPHAPHVFQGFAPLLDEAREALDQVGAFLAAALGA